MYISDSFHYKFHISSNWIISLYLTTDCMVQVLTGQTLSSRILLIATVGINVDMLLMMFCQSSLNKISQP